MFKKIKVIDTSKSIRISNRGFYLTPGAQPTVNDILNTGTPLLNFDLEYDPTEGIIKLVKGNTFSFDPASTDPVLGKMFLAEGLIQEISAVDIQHGVWYLFSSEVDEWTPVEVPDGDDPLPPLHTTVANVQFKVYNNK